MVELREHGYRTAMVDGLCYLSVCSVYSLCTLCWNGWNVILMETTEIFYYDCIKRCLYYSFVIHML